MYQHKGEVTKQRDDPFWETELALSTRTDISYNKESQQWALSGGGPVSGSAVRGEIQRQIAAAQEELAGLTRNLFAGRINTQEWQIASAGVIKDAHLSLAAFGSGGRDGMGFEEFGRVGGTLNSEYRFLNTFAEDLAAGRLTEAQALARIQQYGNAAGQSYNREFDRRTPTGLEVWWVLNPGESCNDCVSQAAGSPYAPGELTIFPQSGQTVCRGNCNCELQRREKEA